MTGRQLFKLCCFEFIINILAWRSFGCNMAVAFSSDGADAIQQKVTVQEEDKIEVESVDDFLEVERCIAWVKEGGYQNVALQYPDDLLHLSVAFVEKLEAGTECKSCILGDTSYGSCCVDEVAAEHYKSDCIIHFGHSCLSVTQRLPVLYVFGKHAIDLTDCIKNFHDIFPDKQSKVILMYDTVYAHCSDAFYKEVESGYSNILCSTIDSFSTSSKCISSRNKKLDKNRTNGSGRSFSIPGSDSISDYTIFYIGSESLCLTNLIYTYNMCKFCTYNPINRNCRFESINVNKMLKKRFYFIERAKDANIVGIIVGTLGVANYINCISHLKRIIKKAGKKSYLFVVGKLNVAKLANFMEVDIFVLVACCENSLLDSSDFYKPVITPYEMEMACNPNREWSTEYVTDYQQILEGGNNFIECPEFYESEADVSLITGKLRTLGEKEAVQTSTTVMTREDALSLVTSDAETAGDFLKSRSWKGLEKNVGKTEVVKAVEGTIGIASEYEKEGKE